MQLRSYQIEVIERIKEKFKETRRQYIEMPTGSGKTITFLKYAKENHDKTLVVVPTKELQKQCAETALRLYQPWEISRKGNGYNESADKIHICIVNSITRKYIEDLQWEDFDLVVIDEAHHANAPTYKRLIEELWNSSDPLFLGVTATPDRSDGKLLDDILWDKTYFIGIEKLIEQEHLCDLEGYIVKTKIDISDLDNRNGDFSLKELYKRLSNETRNGMILDICKNEMCDRKNIIFCINVDHSIEIAKILNANGLKAACIYGKMEEKKKENILNSFRSGEINFLCNCQLLTEGFDEPSIDGIILARPTSSRSLFIQMIGRGLRKYEGKKFCKVIDIVDNNSRLSRFSDLLTSERYGFCERFNGIKDIKKFIHDEEMKTFECKIERTNLLGFRKIDGECPTKRQIEYLEKNNIYLYPNISFDDASFLIWMNELKKEMRNGIN